MNESQKDKETSSNTSESSKALSGGLTGISDLNATVHANSANSLNINAIQLLEIAKRWHSKIHDELASPILPEGISEKALEEKTKAISRQREKHKMYSRALEALIRTSQKKKEKNT